MESENFDLESSGLSGSQEAPSEKSEKQKESSKKAQSQLQKTQKDEKKAKVDNDELFTILSKFIQNPFYEELIPLVNQLLEKSFPSRPILALVALIYPEATLYILDQIGKRDEIVRMTSLYRYQTLQIFEEKTLHESIRGWISFWMSFSSQFLVQESNSVVLGQKLLILLESDDRKIFTEALMRFFQFFLTTRNIEINESLARSYSVFIVSEFEKIITHWMEQADGDLRSSQDIDVKTLFGV